MANSKRYTGFRDYEKFRGKAQLHETDKRKKRNCQIVLGFVVTLGMALFVVALFH